MKYEQKHQINVGLMGKYNFDIENCPPQEPDKALVLHWGCHTTKYKQSSNIAQHTVRGQLEIYLQNLTCPSSSPISANFQMSLVLFISNCTCHHMIQ